MNIAIGEVDNNSTLCILKLTIKYDAIQHANYQCNNL